MALEIMCSVLRDGVAREVNEKATSAYFAGAISPFVANFKRQKIPDQYFRI